MAIAADKKGMANARLAPAVAPADVVSSRAETSAMASGAGYRFYHCSCKEMLECKDCSISLTVTSPPYWNAIDYDLHAKDLHARDLRSRQDDSSGAEVWYRERVYSGFGATLEEYLENISLVFAEVFRATKAGGFCAIVIGTLLHKGKHYPTPMLITERMLRLGWDFHQDIIWNKVTGGVKRAGCFIQHPRAGYYYPNIMTEYILLFRKSGDFWREDKQEAMAIDDVFKRDIANNIWHIAPVPPRTISHPCPYPEELVRRLVLLYSREGDEVLDPFLGSGQTALVARRYDRRVVGYEIEGSYITYSESRLHSPPARRKYNLLPTFAKVAAV